MPRETTEDIARTLSRAGRKRRWPVWLVLVAVLAAAGAGGWYWMAGRQAGTAVRYVTEPVARGTLTVTVTATGTVEPTTTVEVSSEISGRLDTVEVDYNDQVTVGQVLARLDDTRLKAQLINAQASVDAARAQLANAEATLTEAKFTFDAQSQLDQRGVGTHRDLVMARAAHERAQASVELGRANLTQAEASLAMLRTDLDKAVIRSPIEGVVLNRQAEVGQIVAATLQAPTLFTLAGDLTRMQVQVNIDEADIGRVRVGNAGRFTVDAYSGRAFDAELVQLRFAPETTDGVVTYKGVLAVGNADLLLRPGMTATATITVAEETEALLVPNAALRYAPPAQTTAGPAGGGRGLVGMIMPRMPRAQRNAVAGPGAARSVWVLRAGAPVEVTVRAGDSDGRRTVILEGDLAEGDQVITEQTGGA